MTARAERQQGEVARLEQELTSEARAQETEVSDVTESYQRLEKVVSAHLQALQKALLSTTPCTSTAPAQQSPTYMEQHIDDSLLSCSFNDENVFSSMRATNVV